MKLSLGDSEVLSHHAETQKLAGLLDEEDVVNWLLDTGYYPESYVLPPFYSIYEFKGGNSVYKFTKKKKSEKWHWKSTVKVKRLVKTSYPTEGLTTRTFALIHPNHYQDIAYIIGRNFQRFVRSYGAKRIFSYTFPIPLDSNSPGVISQKRSERQIYEYIEAAEQSLLIDARDYKYVVIADIKQFYPSIYTHSISWAIHSKELIRKSNERNYDYIGNRIDKLFHYSNDRKTNGIAVGPAVSDVISEWLLNSIDKKISEKLPGRSFGIRFKDDYRIVCDSEDEAKEIIQTVQRELSEYDLSLSEEKTTIEKLPDGLYRPWILEYDHFVRSLLKDAAVGQLIPFRKYIILQRKVFEMNRNYSAKGITEKFLGRLIGNNFELLVQLNTPKNKKMFIANMVLLIDQKPKVIGQVLGIFESILDVETRPIIQTILDELWSKYSTNEFMLCWLYYFAKANNLTVVRQNDTDMPLLYSLESNSQKFFQDNPAQLITKFEDITVSISEYVSLFKD